MERKQGSYYIGVRNKYCYVCLTAKNKQEDPQEHECFKNWDSDSQSMESDIIVEWFQCSESKHGVRYMRIVDVGDSSVFAKIKEEVPVWGGMFRRRNVQTMFANVLGLIWRS